MPDGFLLELLTRFPSEVLGRLAQASAVFRAYVLHDDIWRPRVLGRCGGDFDFAGSWYRTFLGVAAAERTRRCGGKPATATPEVAPIRRANSVFSDELYQPWFLASAPYPEAWISHESIPRRAGLTAEAFSEQYEDKNLPVVVTDWTAGWAAHQNWAVDRLANDHNDVRFEVFDEYTGPVQMKLDKYARYAAAVKEERPLYLFEPWFAGKVAQFDRDYAVPDAFKDDLFSVLGAERPDYRWLLMGPRGSGAAFHQDPNATAAWNAVISGRKKWIMYPPSVRPPGVHPNGDVDATSVVDWFMRYYVQIQQQNIDPSSVASRNRPWECVQEPGEMVFIPHRWWHMALNLDLTVAVTHNFVSTANVADVCQFLETSAAEVCVRTTLIDANGGRGDRAGLHAKFIDALKRERPAVYAACQQTPGAGNGATPLPKKSTAVATGERASFSFNF